MPENRLTDVVSRMQARVAGLLLAVQLDHCLHTQELSVTAFRTGGDIGSDHLPIIVDLSFRRHRPEGVRPR